MNLSALIAAIVVFARGLWLSRVVLLTLVVLASEAQAGTELSFWHSYTPPAGEIHFSFHIANYKRGLFFGSCGPSTRSLQWAYDVCLVGKGPVYRKEQITITSDSRSVAVADGTITIDSKQQRATIDLRAGNQDGPTNFVGNGTWRIRKAK